MSSVTRESAAWSMATIEKSSPGYECYIHDDGAIAGGRLPAIVYGRTFEETERRARLVSAAPTMLAALEALYEHCAMVHRYWGDGCNREQAEAAIDAGRAAIVHAKGGAA